MREHLEDESAYIRGYRAGYIDGLKAGRCGEVDLPDRLQMPMEILGLSTRALNCLRACQCRSVQDIVELPEERILRMRNLGRKSADEIARALHEYKLFGSCWDVFRL